MCVERLEHAASKFFLHLYYIYSMQITGNFLNDVAITSYLSPASIIQHLLTTY